MPIKRGKIMETKILITLRTGKVLELTQTEYDELKGSLGNTVYVDRYIDRWDNPYPSYPVNPITVTCGTPTVSYDDKTTAIKL